MIAQRDQAPPLLDEGRGTDVVGVDRRAGAGELGGRRLRGGRGELLVAVDEFADLFLELAQLADEQIHLLEVRDDLALHRFALGAGRRGVELARDRIVLRPERSDWGIDHQTVAFCIALSIASFSLELSSRAVLSAITVRPSFTTIPVMYSAASPFTMLGGAVTSLAATCSTSVTASTTTPILPPSHSRITVRVSSRSGAGAPSRLRRSTSGIAPPPPAAPARPPGRARAEARAPPAARPDESAAPGGRAAASRRAPPRVRAARRAPRPSPRPRARAPAAARSAGRRRGPGDSRDSWRAAEAAARHCRCGGGAPVYGRPPSREV